MPGARLAGGLASWCWAERMDHSLTIARRVTRAAHVAEGGDFAR